MSEICSHTVQQGTRDIIEQYACRHL